jgi:hypothetical protein
MTEGTTPPRAGAPLRLRAEDHDDLAIIAACLQDAVVRIEEMSYLPARHRFAVVCSRFRWEREHRGARHGHERIRCGIHFEGILAAGVRGIAQGQGGPALELLTIRAEPMADDGRYGNLYIELVFAGGATVRLEAEFIECHLSDLGDAWETRSWPSHAIDENDENA